jgi:hypothetical protein
MRKNINLHLIFNNIFKYKNIKNKNKYFYFKLNLGKLLTLNNKDVFYFNLRRHSNFDLFFKLNEYKYNHKNAKILFTNILILKKKIKFLFYLYLNL